MLLERFDNSRQCVEIIKTTAVLTDNRISLQLHTDSGGKPLTDDHIVDGWKLKPKEDLTVYIDYTLVHTILLFHACMHLYAVCIIIVGIYE